MTTWLPAGTPKAMFLVWGEGLGSALTAPALREALAATGALRLQVNLDDEHVSDALRFGTGDPIGAVVSVWGPEPERVAGALADHLASSAPGAATAGWLVEHTPIAIRTQATSAYLQHRCLAPLPGSHPDPPHVDAIVEELFPTAGMHDVHAFYGSGGDDAELSRRMTELMASVSRIGADRDLDLVPGSRHLWDLQPHTGLVAVSLRGGWPGAGWQGLAGPVLCRVRDPLVA